MIGAYDKENLVGVLGFRKKHHILLLYVEKHRIRQNIGRILLQHFIKICEDDMITLNAASYTIGFYKKLGFVEAGSIESRHGIISTPMQYRRSETIQ